MCNLAIGQHLFTKDGRKIGNASIIGKERKSDTDFVWLVETDSGNIHRKETAEIEKEWHTTDENGTVLVTYFEDWLAERQKRPEVKDKEALELRLRLEAIRKTLGVYYTGTDESIDVGRLIESRDAAILSKEHVERHSEKTIREMRAKHAEALRDLLEGAAQIAHERDELREGKQVDTGDNSVTVLSKMREAMDDHGIVQSIYVLATYARAFGKTASYIEKTKPTAICFGGDWYQRSARLNDYFESEWNTIRDERRPA